MSPLFSVSIIARLKAGEKQIEDDEKKEDTD